MSRGAPAGDDIIALVTRAIQVTAASVADLLECVAYRFNAFGCVLWDVTPAADLTVDPPKGHLFVQAAWFPTRELFAMHDLAFQYGSGQAVIKQKPTKGVRGQDNVILFDHPFLKRYEINKLCAVPLQFINGGKGAITIYRRENEPLFTDDDEIRLVQCATVVPHLCQAIQNKVSLDLLSQIEIILQEAERASQSSPISKNQEREYLQQICEKAKEAFHCYEISVFLEDALTAKGTYSLQATTRESWVKKPEYRAKKKDGLDGWVLAERKPMKLFDLMNFDPTDPVVQKQYPGVMWEDPLKVRTLTPDELGIPTDEEKPPLSFMATPCIVGRDLMGVVRCFVAKRGPFYFSDWELRLLELVAAQIAQCWFGWQTKTKAEQEKKSWRELVVKLGELNNFVSHELVSKAAMPSEAIIIKEALRLTSSVVPGADVNDVRLLDPATNELYFAANPDFELPDASGTIKAGLGRRFLVAGPITSAGVKVFQTGEPYVMKQTWKDPLYKEIFPGVTSMVIAPIQIGGQKFGVLDLRWLNHAPIPSHAVDAAVLVGKQLGMYHVLVSSVTELRRAQEKAVRDEKNQRQILEDLAHQLKSPLIQAQRRANLALYSETAPEERQLMALHGLCRKARRVSMSMRLIAELTHGQVPKLKRDTMDLDRLEKMLVEMAQDTEITVDPSRQISIKVGRSDHRNPLIRNVLVDYDLLEQALNNLFDNAAKYSFDHTDVWVRTSTSQSDRFYIAIANKGIPIREGDVQKCKVRGWRSDEAKMVTGEGSGIGLWIVDQIMLAHDGELEINRRTIEGLTEVRIYFPRSEIRN